MTTYRTYTGYAAIDLGVSGNPVVGQTFDIATTPPLSIVTQDDDADTNIGGDVTNEVNSDGNQFVYIRDDGGAVIEDGRLFYLEASFTYTVAGDPTVYTGYMFEIDEAADGFDFVIFEPGAPSGTATIQSVNFNPAPNSVDYDALASGNESFDTNFTPGTDLSGNDTIIGGAGNDTIDGGGGDDSILGDGGGLAAPADTTDTTTGTTFQVISLGNSAIELDPIEAGGLGGVSENGDQFENTTFGSTVDPLSGRVQTLIPGGGNGDGQFDGDNNVSNDTFFINGVEFTYDGSAVYNNTIVTFEDGTTATISAVVFQDTNGNLYLAPESSNNADTAALISQPITSIVLGTQDTSGAFGNGLVATRVVDSWVESSAAPAAGDDSLSGGAGNDTILGGGGDDSILGGDGIDSIEGGAGNDTIDGGLRTDFVFGGAGDDSITDSGGAASDDTIFGGSGDDTISGGAREDLIEGGTENDSVFGGDGGDTIIGGEGNDTLHGDAGDDLIRGDGDSAALGTTTRESFNWDLIPDPDDGGAIDNLDNIEGGTVQNTGTMDVTLTYTAGPNATNFVFANDETQFIDGLDGGGETVDNVGVGRLEGEGLGDTSSIAFDFASNDPNTLEGATNVQFRINDVDETNFRDTFTVRAFDPNGNPIPVTLSTTGTSIVFTDEDGVAGAETASVIDGTGNLLPADAAGSVLVEIAGPVGRIELDYGNDETALQRIHITDVFFDTTQVDPAATFDDVISGDAGNDTLLGEFGDDTISGGDDQDSIDGGVGEDSLSGDAGDDTISGGAGADTLDGGVGADSLSGGSETDSIAGGAGADTLDGGAGDDLLVAGTEDDTILASTGNDLINGGEGVDTYTVPGSSTIPADTETITVRVDENGDGTVVKTVDGTTDVIGSVENFVAGEAAAESDVFIYETIVDERDRIVGLDDATGIFVDLKDPANPGPPIFFGGPGQPTFQDLLGQVGVGNFVLNGGDRDGSLDDINFTDFETVLFSVVCFTRGAMIETIDGEVPVEALSVGDLVLTADRGHQPIRWIGSRRFDRAALEAQPHLRPVTIRKGAFGLAADLRVSQQHRMLIANAQADLLFGEPEVLVKARDLTYRDDAFVADVDEVEYFHILFDDHELVRANGAWSESLHPGVEALSTLAAESREEVLAIFPELRGLDGRAERPLARYPLKTSEARALVN